MYTLGLVYLAWTVFIANVSRKDGMNKQMRTWNNVRLVSIMSRARDHHMWSVGTTDNLFVNPRWWISLSLSDMISNWD